jgi:GTP cyclohydrolase I
MNHNSHPVDLIEPTSLQQIVKFQPVYPSSEGIAPLIREMLVDLGENPEREGLRRTPDRVARMYDEILSGYRTDLTALVNDAIFETEYQDMVLVRNLKFYSLCEHHMLPFFGQAHVAYIPDRKIIGLSKIPRLVDMFSKRLQVQERMTQQIAETLESILHPRGVAVMVEGAHMCAMMRGVKKNDIRMVTSAYRGNFRNDEKLRNEFLNQLRSSEKEENWMDA